MARNLEVSFRCGRPMVAYLYLTGGAPPRSARSEEREAGIVVDFGEDGHPIGLEFTAPSAVTLEALNRVLASLNLPPADRADVAPLAAA
ncbi:MAG: DUF2283 domain-containing protein [Phycisphaerales bacterium]